MKKNPDAPCPCGSKKSYRSCCKPRDDRNRMFLFIGVTIGGIFAAKLMFTDPRIPPAPPGKVWSAEHGHYHDAPQTNAQTPAGGANTTPGSAAGSTAPPAGNLNMPQPDGPVPPGKVWSTEHGHWHDLVQTNAQSPVAPSPGAPGQGATPAGNALVPQPAGPVPAGKVWSPDHGHWHDAPKP